ncbi:hypothetical protein QAD02_003891 [Eretmocerus hayati]|uniref:Uncharacterized protein n=1 Tax=Eretmocerus hayati TaxID=131215 RepID=A0ACC2NNE5_9HYME|nr:hypothetical protein QAD02_003891 [Eretmocerus hayati]
MPTSLFADMDRPTGGGPGGGGPGSSASIEEQRALQLAFELSMLGLDQAASGSPNGHSSNGSGPVVVGCNGVGSGGPPSPNHLVDGVVVSGIAGAPGQGASVFEEARSKKSQNMTECVPVPSSEHVAEIVGRQGELFTSVRSE